MSLTPNNNNSSFTTDSNNNNWFFPNSAAARSTDNLVFGHFLNHHQSHITMDEQQQQQQQQPLTFTPIDINSSTHHITTTSKNNKTDTSPPTQKSKKKQKVACVYCNKLHKKCDGEPPNTCSRCSKKSIPCVYLPPQKRGPKSKKRKTTDGEDDDYYSTELTTEAQLSTTANQNEQIQQLQLQQAQQQFNTPVYFNHGTSQQRSQQLEHVTTAHQSQIVGSIDLDTYISESLFSPISNRDSNQIQPTYQSSPLTGLQFAVNVHTRTLVDQFLDSVTCHSLVEKNMLENALTKAVTYSSEPTGYQLLTNIVCAMGAQRLEDRKNCIDFFNRARNQASYLFDMPSRETSCALSLMGIYACSEGERIKGHIYNRIALDMSTNMCRYQVENDKYFHSLSALSLATNFSKWLFELNILKVEENSIDILLKHGNNPNHPQVPQIRDLVKSVKSFINSQYCMRKIEDLENRINDMTLVKGSEEISFTAILVYYLLDSRIASLSNNNQVEYIKLLRKLETIEKYVESDKFNRDDIQKNVHRFCLYSLRSDILVKCGLDKMGLHCATKATGLAAKPTFWKSAPDIILFFPVLINVNLNVNDSSMSIENYKSLKIISSKFVVLKYTLFDMISAMNKRSEFSDLLATEKQHVTSSSVSNATGTLQFPNDIPMCESCIVGQDGWDASALFEDANNESCFQTTDITEMLQQLGTAHDHESYQNKLESIWQSIAQ
ncbi:GAL4-domain-containing protein [Naegleria gruberi]|uniref:GAL4-domain-containing protein n=1 Tax=Naegleria gruberi TaxID=5762 RepID=D2UYZ4_NAEGR|nr:GAL4-domain-containing protein [Naegleria gruberi]EFC49861.1 GAL4-domain-containing protein [Naegleria gruberi]|eukprot:XP_002682605.1 GAL4-domain-containing protein [Naegleria gruberi strain NEG-M]